MLTPLISLVTFCEKCIPVQFSSFTPIKLINPDLNIATETVELGLFSFAETFFDLILIHRDDTDEEFVRIAKTTRLYRLVHELGEFVWKLYG